jgi:hypothetical protein
MNPDKTLVFKDRIEFANYISHLRMEYLKRFADRRPIIEQYLRAAIVIHAHFAKSTVNGCHDRVCLRYRRVQAQIDSFGGETAHNGPFHEVPVFIDVGESVQKLEVRSVVRLEPLDQCDVFVAEMFETARPILLKELWSIIDRKLSAILLVPRMDTSANKNNVVERCAKVENDLANDQKPLRIDPGIAKELLQNMLCLVRGQITIRESGIEYAFADLSEERFQLRQLFFCPTMPEMRLLKEAHLI